MPLDDQLNNMDIVLIPHPRDSSTILGNKMDADRHEN